MWVTEVQTMKRFFEHAFHGAAAMALAGVMGFYGFPVTFSSVWSAWAFFVIFSAVSAALSVWADFDNAK